MGFLSPPLGVFLPRVACLSWLGRRVMLQEHDNFGANFRRPTGPQRRLGLLVEGSGRATFTSAIQPLPNNFTYCRDPVQEAYCFLGTPVVSFFPFYFGVSL